MISILEVMDKEPGITSFWISGLIWGAAGFLLARRRWWWALPILAITVVAFLGTWGEWTDRYVGPAIAAEAGHLYPYHLIASSLLVIGLTLTGLWRGRRAV